MSEPHRGLLATLPPLGPAAFGPSLLFRGAPVRLAILVVSRLGTDSPENDEPNFRKSEDLKLLEALLPHVNQVIATLKTRESGPRHFEYVDSLPCLANL